MLGQQDVMLFLYDIIYVIVLSKSRFMREHVVTKVGEKTK